MRYDIGFSFKRTDELFMRTVVPVYNDEFKLIGRLGRSLFIQCPICNKYHAENRMCPTNKVEEMWAAKWRNSQGFNTGNYFYNAPSTLYSSCIVCETPPPPTKVSASYVVNCTTTSYGSVVFNNFLGGSGQYQMTKTYYTNCSNAVLGTFVDVVSSNTYVAVPNGLVYFVIRDKNNISNFVCISVQISCSAGGGGCPTPDMLIMVDGGWVKANDLNVGDMVYTIHEFTNEWGNYSIDNKKIEYYPVLLTVIGNTTIKVSDSHKFLTEYGDYISINNINIGDKIQTINGLQELISKNEIGEMEVVRFEINDAHTYVVDGIISHNKLIPDIISDEKGNISAV